MASSKQQDKVAGQRVGDAFRTAAGLPARKNDKPSDQTKVNELSTATEPDKGYGGKDGIDNTGAMSSDERAHLERREEAVASTEGSDLTGGETATEVARVTGEPVVDEKPAPGTTPEELATGSGE